MNKSTTSSLRNLIATLALMSATAAATPALADTGDALYVHVKYGDLDLNNSAGVNELYNRIRAASTKVCEPFSGRELALIPRYNACFATAMSHAVMDVKQPALTALYSEKTGNTHQQRLALLDVR